MRRSVGSFGTDSKYSEQPKRGDRQYSRAASNSNRLLTNSKQTVVCSRSLASLSSTIGLLVG